VSGTSRIPSEVRYARGKVPEGGIEPPTKGL
jgi:hypothetical protein